MKRFMSEYKFRIIIIVLVGIAAAVIALGLKGESRNVEQAVLATSTAVAEAEPVLNLHVDSPYPEYPYECMFVATDETAVEATEILPNKITRLELPEGLSINIFLIESGFGFFLELPDTRVDGPYNFKTSMSYVQIYCVVEGEDGWGYRNVVKLE